MKKIFVLLFCFIVPSVCFSQIGEKNMITKQEIIKAQKEWGDGIVAIGKAYSNEKDYRKIALDFVDNFYAY